MTPRGVNKTTHQPRNRHNRRNADFEIFDSTPGMGGLLHRLRLTVDSAALQQLKSTASRRKTTLHLRWRRHLHSSSSQRIKATAAAPAPCGHHKGATNLKPLHLDKGASLPSLTRTVRPPPGTATVTSNNSSTLVNGSRDSDASSQRVASSPLFNKGAAPPQALTTRGFPQHRALHTASSHAANARATMSLRQGGFQQRQRLYLRYLTHPPPINSSVCGHNATTAKSVI